MGLIHAAIGAVQEGKAERALDAVRAMLADRASVVRDKRRIEVGDGALVPDEVVVLESGARVPTELRLPQRNTLRIGASALTGESVAVDKDTAAMPATMPIAERSDMAFAGTVVRYGQARGVVVRQLPIFDVFLALVGLAVATMLEGLPAVVTIMLAIRTRNRARQRALVRKLPAVETLGSVALIYTGETGTLTRNEMTVAQAMLPRDRLAVSGSGNAARWVQ